MKSGLASRRGASRSKLWIGAGILGVLLVGAYLLFTMTRDMQRGPPRLVGSVWTASAEGTGRVYFVTREDRAVARSFDTDGAYTYQHSYSVYTLHSRAAADGSPLVSTQIARIETTSPDFQKYRAYQTLPEGPGILGPQDDVLWLWNSGLEARDLRTLETVWTTEGLRGRNPELASLLPDDPKYARVIGPLDTLVFKGTDARYFRVDRASGVFSPIDEPAFAALSHEHTKTADTAFTSLGPTGDSLRSVSVSGLIVNAVLDEGTWYALLTADQRAGLKGHLGSMEDWNFRWGSIAEAASSLFSGRYQLEREVNFPRTTITLDTTSVTPIGNERFLMAGFLRRPGAVGPWTVEAAADATNPARTSAVKSYVVLHRQTIGEQGRWSLTLVGRDGTRLWTCDTGLTELNHVNDGGTSIVITGLSHDSRPRGEWPDQMIFVDEATGTRRMLNVATGIPTAGKD